MFSIIIPTFNNLDYLKLCIKSIRQNSKYTHQIIPHVNIGSDKTSEFLVNENIDYTFTDYNSYIHLKTFFHRNNLNHCQSRIL